MNTRRRTIAWCLVVLLASCGSLRSPGGAGEPWLRDRPQPQGEADSLLIYFEYVRRLAPAELAKEQEVVRHLYTGSRTDFIRVRFAIANSLPGDDGRALDALGPLLKNSDAALHGIAFMVATQIQDQRRAQGLHDKLDALKQMEKQMIERDPANSTRRQ